MEVQVTFSLLRMNLLVISAKKKKRKKLQGQLASILQYFVYKHFNHELQTSTQLPGKLSCPTTDLFIHVTLEST